MTATFGGVTRGVSSRVAVSVAKASMLLNDVSYFSRDGQDRRAAQRVTSQFILVTIVRAL